MYKSYDICSVFIPNYVAWKGNEIKRNSKN